jgi:hypothetical protein
MGKQSVFSDAFVKLQETTFSFVMSVRLSAWNNWAHNERISIKFDIGAFLENLPRKFKIHYDRTVKIGTIRDDQHTFLIMSRAVHLRMISEKSCRGNKTHILCSVFLFFENPAVCEIIWKNIVESGRPQITWLVRFACWTPKAKNTHSQYVILIAFPLKQWLHERASMLRLYVHCLSCFLRSVDVWAEHRIYEYWSCRYIK